LDPNLDAGVDFWKFFDLNVGLFPCDGRHVECQKALDFAAQSVVSAANLRNPFQSLSDLQLASLEKNLLGSTM
jgi:hypothetical protein